MKSCLFRSVILRATCVVILFSAVSTRLSAQVVDAPKIDLKPVDLKKFLKPGEATLGPSQRRAAMLHQVSAFFRAADLNHDGDVTDSEIKLLKQQALEDADFYFNKEKEMFGKESATVEKIYESHLIGKPAVEFSPNPWGLQVRRTLEDVTPAVARDSSPADKFKAAKPAELGFTSNNVSGNDAYSVRGVVTRPFDTSFGYWMPSVQFDRVGNSTDTTKDINSLILGATAGWIPQTEEGFLRFQEIRFGLRHATNFDFEPGLSGGEIQYRPLFNFKSNGAFAPIFGSEEWQYRTRQYLHAESGLDDRDADVNDSYFRAGGAVGLELVPGISRLLLTAEYRYYADLLDNADANYDNFKATAAWKLDEQGNFVLQASYENGLLPLSLQEIDLFSFGLGIKY